MNYYLMYNVGHAKYVVNYHNGERFCDDGSKFYDLAIFKNKKKLEEFVNKLIREGYEERRFSL